METTQVSAAHATDRVPGACVRRVLVSRARPAELVFGAVQLWGAR